MSAHDYPLQLDLLCVSGLKMTRAAHTVLDDLERLASFHDGQSHFEASISITPRQARELEKTLLMRDRTLVWGRHPLRVVGDL